MELSEPLRALLTAPDVDDVLDVAAAAVTETGAVTVTVEQLVDPRAFKHVSHPLSAGYSVLDARFGWEVAGRLTDAVWRLLVARHLLPVLPVAVTLAHGAYNSAWARFVDGLTENDDVLDYRAVTVEPADVTAAYRDALAALLDGHDRQAAAADDRSPGRPSTRSHGLAGLVGRRVEVACTGGADTVCGTMIAWVDQCLVVATEDRVTVVPLSAVAAVSTWQLAVDELDVAR